MHIFNSVILECLIYFLCVKIISEGNYMPIEMGFYFTFFGICLGFIAI